MEILVDPWKDCERIYDNHFMDRMNDRYLPPNQIKIALKEGKKIETKKNEYQVRWEKWEIVVSLRRCFLYLRTAYHT